MDDGIPWPVRRLADRPQSIEGTRQGELRGPEALDEIAAPDPAGILHRAQDRVDGTEPARDAFGGHGLAGHDAMPLEQGETLGMEPLGRRDGRNGQTAGRNGRIARRHGPLGQNQRPAAGGFRWPKGRQATRSRATRLRATPGPLPAQGPQRRERVIGDLARPDEIPQGIEHLAIRRAARGREQFAIERRPARPQVLADRDVARLGRWLHSIGRAGRLEDLATRPDERDPAVVSTKTPPPHPGDLAQRP